MYIGDDDTVTEISAGASKSLALSSNRIIAKASSPAPDQIDAKREEALQRAKQQWKQVRPELETVSRQSFRLQVDADIGLCLSARPSTSCKQLTDTSVSSTLRRTIKSKATSPKKVFLPSILPSKIRDTVKQKQQSVLLSSYALMLSYPPHIPYIHLVEGIGRHKLYRSDISFLPVPSSIIEEWCISG